MWSRAIIAAHEVIDSDFQVDPRALANFILDKFGERNLPVTNLSLQKYMYFCHGWSLGYFSRPLIDREFEAWQFGPVCRLVYSQFSNARRNPITTRAHLMTPTGATTRAVPYGFSTAMSGFLLHVLEEYRFFKPFQLSDMTHSVGSPWWTVRTGDEFERLGQSKIPDSLILEWFENSLLKSTH